jgi:HEAT repeat protein
MRLRKLFIWASVCVLTWTVAPVPAVASQPMAASATQPALRPSPVPPAPTAEDPVVALAATLLKHEDWQVRRNAVESLRAAKSRRAAELASSALADPSDEVRRAAESVLRETGHSAGEMIAAALRRASPAGRIRIMRFVTPGADRALRAALEAQARDRRWPVRLAAVGALRRVRPRAVAALGKAMADPSPLVRLAAIGTRPGDEESTEVFEAYARRVIQALADSHSRVRREARSGLWGIADRAYGLLLRATESPHAEVRAAVVQIIGRRDPQKSAAALAGLLADPDWRVRQAALQRLRGLSAQYVRRHEQQIAARVQDDNEQVRLAAIRALETVDVAVRVKALAGLLDDPSREVRYAAVQKLRLQKAEPSVDALAKALTDDDVAVRKVAALTLAGWQDRRAVPALAELLKNADGSQVREVVEKLGCLADKRAVPALVEATMLASDNARAAAIRALDALNAAPMDVLESALLDHPHVAHAAVVALGRMDGKRASRLLLDSLRHASPSAASAAAAALAERGEKRAVAPLIRALRRPSRELRAAAVRALARLGDARAIRPIAALLTRAVSEVDRHAAVEALQQFEASGEDTAEVIRALRLPSGLDGNAIEEFGRLGPAAVEPLIALLEDPAVRYPSALMTELGQLGDARATQPVLRFLESGRPVNRASAAYALGRLGDRAATPVLIEYLEDTHSQVRRRAVEALGRLRDERAVEPLVGALRQPRFRSDRTTVVSALVRIGGKTTVRKAIELLNAEDAAWIRTGAEILSRLRPEEAFGPLAKRAAGLEEPSLKGAAIRAMDRIGGTMPIPLLAVSFDTRDKTLRHSARDALQRMGRTAVPILIAALRSKLPDARADAAEVLGRLGDPRALAPLVGALADDHVRVRTAAAVALGSYQDEQAVAALIAALKDDEPAVRAAAAHQLGWLGHPRAVEPLIAVLNAGPQASSRRPPWRRPYRLAFPSSSPVRAAALSLCRIGGRRATAAVLAHPAVLELQIGWRPSRFAPMALLGHKQVVDALLRFLKHEHAGVRSNAARVMAALGDQRCIEPLVELLADAPLRRAAAEALLALGDGRGLTWLRRGALQQLSFVPKAVGRSLARRDKGRVIAILMKELRGAGARVGTPVIIALEHLKATEAVEPLAAVAGDQTADARTRTAAVQALERIGGSKAVPALCRILSDTRDEHKLRTSIARALGTLGDRRAIQSLVNVLADRYSEVRAAAVEALGRLGDPQVVDRLLKVRDVYYMTVALALLNLNDVKAFERITAALGEQREWEDLVLALRRGGRRAPLDAVIALLKKGDWPERKAAARMLGGFPNSRCVQALIAALGEKDYDVGKEAFSSLKRLFGTRNPDVLLEILRNAGARQRLLGRTL